MVGLMLPDRQVLLVKNYGRCPTTGAGASLTQFHILEPERRVRFTFDGPTRESSFEELLHGPVQDGPTGRCVIEVIFEATCPIWHMSGESGSASAIAGAMHFEQIGQVHGSIRYNEREYTVTSGCGIRDHSRGAREPSRYKRHCWVSGQFSAESAFHMYSMELQGHDSVAMANAALLENGRWEPAQVVHTEFILSPRWKSRSASRSPRFQ